MRTEHTNDRAIAAFIARKAEIDAMLARLAALSDEHFGYAPDEINWGHVGTLASYAELLKRITDAAFQEGEHQPDSRL
ncbi:MAG: hypothetical protein Kow00104_03340 [Rhodothalassiaceae bacterium]